MWFYLKSKAIKVTDTRPNPLVFLRVNATPARYHILAPTICTDLSYTHNNHIQPTNQLLLVTNQFLFSFACEMHQILVCIPTQHHLAIFIYYSSTRTLGRRKKW